MPPTRSSQSERFARALMKCGYEIQENLISDIQSLDTNDLHCQVLFILNSDYMADLSQQLCECPDQPRLAVFAEDVRWNYKILSYCTEVLTWPCSESELKFRLDRVLSMARSQVDNLLSDVFMRLNMIGEAPSFLRTRSLIQRIAPYDANILISGETGTGKELAARALHYLGKYSDGPFIAVNCGGIPDELFENELFGHVTGAYTDAKSKQIGYVEQADGGTLFLDEIDALSLKGQATLLRFLQDQCYKPLGSEKFRHANIRFIAAANSNLRMLVEARQFRQDLLFRLDVLSVELPSLRDRPGDAVLLAEHLIKKFSREFEKPLLPLHPEFLSWMQTYSWPGNVRELENAVLRAFLLSEGMYVAQIDVQNNQVDDPLTLGKFNEQKARAIDGFERQYLDRLLIESHGNVSRAAKLAGKERRALGKLLQKHGINRLDYVIGNH